MKDNKELVILAGKGSGGGSGTDTNAVHYTADSNRSDSEKAAARANIGAVGSVNAEFADGIELVQASSPSDSIQITVDTMAALESAIIIEGDQSQTVAIRGVANPTYPGDAANKAYVDGYQVDVSGTTPTITPVDHTDYKCGTLSSLTVTDPPATGKYSIVFTSGSTATTTTIPNTILGLESFAASANTLYEINVLDNRAVVGSWAVSS